MATAGHYPIRDRLSGPDGRSEPRKSGPAVCAVRPDHGEPAVRGRCLVGRQPVHRYAQSRGPSAQIQSPRYSGYFQLFQPERIYRNCVRSILPKWAGDGRGFDRNGLRKFRDGEPPILPRPGNQQHRFGYTKMIPLNEAMHFEIRGEFFNIFNHAQFNNPAGDISSSNFGNVTSARDSAHWSGQCEVRLVMPWQRFEHGTAGSLAVPFVILR